MAIPYKLFMRMQDLQIAAFDKKDEDGTGLALVNFQEEIGWPWRASQAQLDEWSKWMEYSGMLGDKTGRGQCLAGEVI